MLSLACDSVQGPLKFQKFLYYKLSAGTEVAFQNYVCRRCNSGQGRRSWSTEEPGGVCEDIILSAGTRVYAHVVSGKDSRNVLKHWK